MGHGAYLARLREDLHRLDARTHGEGVAAQGARLVHATRRRDVLHDLLLTRVRAHPAKTEGKAQTCELWFRRPASWGLLAWGVDPCVA